MMNTRPKLQGDDEGNYDVIEGVPVDEMSIRIYRIQSVTSIATTVIRVGGTVAIVFLLTLPFKYLAGENTNAIIQVFAKIDFFTQWLGWGVGAGGVIYGQRQSKLRKRTLKSSGQHMAAMETKIDPFRTSSGLTSEGTTHPGDTP